MALAGREVTGMGASFSSLNVRKGTKTFWSAISQATETRRKLSKETEGALLSDLSFLPSISAAKVERLSFQRFTSERVARRKRPRRVASASVQAKKMEPMSLRSRSRYWTMPKEEASI